LIEYETFDEAQKAVQEMNGEELLGQTLTVDYAFTRGT
jgi:RNA-binding protein 8A